MSQGNDFDPQDIKEVVECLISGMPLTRVPDELHPQLLMPLSAAKNNAIVAGDMPTVKRIQTLMRELKLYPGQSVNQVRARAISRAQTARGSAREVQDDQPVDQVVEEIIDGRPVDTIDGKLIPKLIPALKQKKQQVIATGDYHTSQILEDAIQELNSTEYSTVYDDLKNEKLAQIKVQLLQSEADLQSCESYWAETIQDFNETRDQELEALQSKHQMELEDYENSFPEILPANYRKLSSAVLQLREQEKHLVLTKRYEEAVPIRKRADKLEKEELEAQRDRFIRAFNQQRQKLVDTQSNQIACFNRNWDRKYERLLQDKNSEISTLKRTIANLQKKSQSLESGDSDPTASVVSRSPSAIRTRGTTSPATVNPRVRTVAASRMARSRPRRKPERY